MKKIIAALCFVLLLSSCAPVAPLRIREYKSEDGFIAVADEQGSGVEITTLKNIHFVTINKMSYDYENDSYELQEVLYSTERVASGDSFAVRLDLDREVPYVMIRYRAENGTYFEQYIHKSGDRLLLLERNP